MQGRCERRHDQGRLRTLDGIAGRRAGILVEEMKPIRTDFAGYEGKYVATDTRTGEVVIADEDLKVVLEKARKLDHVVVGGRVPYADEPIYVGLG